MRILFADKGLEKLCTDEKEMRRKRGDIATKLRLRIAALRTAKTVGELPTLDPLGRWHTLTGARAGHWAGWLSRNHRLVVRPEGDGPASASATVTIIDITDYH